MIQARGRWSVVLAGGDGQRMEAFVRRWLGYPRPKQYCAFAGERTMLEHTLDRAVDAAAGRERVVTIVNADHRRYLREPRVLGVPGTLLEQPRRCDTGPGVFLPLTRVMAEDPDALVAVMPSDHFIFPRWRFAELMERAFALAEEHADRIVLLAATPDRAEAEYGWISPGAPLDGNAVLVDAFKEKPSPREAASLHACGGLWNTMIVVCRASALWDIGRSFRPEMAARFEALLPRMGAPGEAEALAEAYRDMPSVNFSRDLLEPAAARTVALPMTELHWSDWGRPARIVETLAQIGRPQAFPAAMAEELAAAA